METSQLLFLFDRLYRMDRSPRRAGNGAGIDHPAGIVSRSIRAELERNKPSLIVLDLMPPGQDGLEVCKEIRSFSGLAIVMVTARVEEIDRLLGLHSVCYESHLGLPHPVTSSHSESLL